MIGAFVDLRPEHHPVRNHLLIAIFALPCLAAAPPQTAPPDAWPTLHGDLSRSGFYPDGNAPRGRLEIVWRKELHTELTGPRAEVIVAAGLAFMGTYRGNFYAWDAKTGEQRWVVETAGPIGHSPMYADRHVYFGSMDRKLRAVRIKDGGVAWTFEADEGIWTSPAVHDGLVMFGARDGVFYGVHQDSGELAWKFQTDGPILTTASISNDGGRVIFASEDMRARCIEVKTGKLLWESARMHGLSVRDYFPVIIGDIAILTTNPVRDFHGGTLTAHQSMLLERAGFKPGDKTRDLRYIAGTDNDVRAEQDFIVDFLKKDPSHQTFYAFRISDGEQPWIAPILYTGGLHNPHAPPCHNPQTGDVFVLLRTVYGTWDGGGEVRAYTGLGKLDMKTGRVELIGHGYPSKDPDRPPGSKDMPWMQFNLIGDETQTLSCAPGMVYSNHQGVFGSLNLETGKCLALAGKRDTYGGFYGPGNFGWESDGGVERAHKAGVPYAIVNEWHGPAKAICSVADGYVYLHVGCQVICLKEKR